MRKSAVMNSPGSGSVVALLSVIFAFPYHVCAADGSTDSSGYTEASSCSELTNRVDRDVCSYHLPAFKALIREKNNQVSPTTPSSTISPSASPIPETVRIRKISAITRLDHEAFRTTYPTLFIFDAERLSGKGQPAVYELPLTVPVAGHLRGVKSFQLPDNSAFVGNRIDILPEFVIEGGIQNHYVMSAPYNDAVYYLANIEIDSRNSPEKSRLSTTATTEYPGSTPTTQKHIPSGILYLRGAGIFSADNIKVILDPADNQIRVRPVELGCTDFADGRGAEERFVYRFTNSEFDLLQGIQRLTTPLNAAFNVFCHQTTGQVQLTMKNTTTVISVPTNAPAPSSPESSGVLFSMILFHRENVMRFVDSICNSVIDQFGNDLSIDLANPSDPDHYMGGIWGSFCTDINMVQGAFGLKDREQAWGWVLGDSSDQYGCEAMEKTYRAEFASVSTWSIAGFDVACNCTATSDCTTQAPDISSTLPPDAGALMMNNTGEAGLTQRQKEGIVFGITSFVGYQAVVNSWFYLSSRIRQAWIRHTSQVLAVVMGFGIPAFQLVPRCVSILRAKKAAHNLLSEEVIFEKNQP